MSKGPYGRSRIERVPIKAPMPSSYRVMASRHRSNPLRMSPADSRFCTMDSGFTVLYAAPEFATALVETVVRDRFTRRRNCEVAVREITARVWSCISTKAGAMLTQLDLRGDGCTRIGAPTDTVNARNHPAGRAFARAIHRDQVEEFGVRSPKFSLVDALKPNPASVAVLRIFAVAVASPAEVGRPKCCGRPVREGV